MGVGANEKVAATFHPGDVDATVARVRALEARWTECLTAYECPSCLAPLNFGGFCDHEEGYHHALSDLREALDPGSAS